MPDSEIPDSETPHVLPHLSSQQRVEARALVGILSALSGLAEVSSVTPGGAPTVPMPLDQSVSVLSSAEHLPGPVRLELVARLMHAERNESAALRGNDVDLGAAVRSLMNPDSDAEPGLGSDLANALSHWVPGTEPLGRTSVEALEHFPLGAKLRPEIACSALVVRPGCGAVSTSVKGIQALSIVTDLYTCKEFDDFGEVVNPLHWHDCWLESLFFRSVEVVPGTPDADTPPPDHGGWRRTLLETVDFSLGTAPDDSQCLKTVLDVTYFWNAAEKGVTGGTKGSAPQLTFGPGAPVAGAVAGVPAAPTVTRSPVAAAGCTYDLVSSVDDAILVDQGYLLVEDIPGTHTRRYRTQKEVCFASGNLPPGSVCSFWSLATGMIMQGC